MITALSTVNQNPIRKNPLQPFSAEELLIKDIANKHTATTV